MCVCAVCSHTTIRDIEKARVFSSWTVLFILVQICRLYFVVVYVGVAAIKLEL